jgi:hypothetical protein
MQSRKIDLLLPLLVVVLAGGAVALVVGLTGTSAEPGPPTPFEQSEEAKVIDARDQTGFSSWGETEPKLPLNELPPPPPPFGTGRRVNPDGSVATSEEPVSPETQQKIDELKRLRHLRFGIKEEGD